MKLVVVVEECEGVRVVLNYCTVVHSCEAGFNFDQLSVISVVATVHEGRIDCWALTSGGQVVFHQEGRL